MYHCDASGRVPHPRGAEAFEITPPYMLLIISPYTAHHMGDRNLFSLSLSRLSLTARQGRSGGGGSVPLRRVRKGPAPARRGGLRDYTPLHALDHIPLHSPLYGGS